MMYDIWHMIYDVWRMIYDVKSDHIICWHGEGKWSHCWKNKTSLLISPFFWIPWVWTRRVLQVENAHGELSSIGWWKLATSIIDDRWWQMAEIPIDWCTIFFSVFFVYTYWTWDKWGMCISYGKSTPVPKRGYFFQHQTWIPKMGCGLVPVLPCLGTKNRGAGKVHLWWP